MPMQATTIRMPLLKITTNGITFSVCMHLVMMFPLMDVDIQMLLPLGTTILMRMIVLTITESHVKVPVVEIRVETQVETLVVKAVLTPMLQTTTLLQALNPLINMET